MQIKCQAANLQTMLAKLIKFVVVPVLLLYSALVSATVGLNCDKSYGFRADIQDYNNIVTGNTVCSSKSSNFIDAVNDYQKSAVTYQAALGQSVMVYGKFNDVTMSMAYGQNSSNLLVNIEQLGISKSFVGKGANIVDQRSDAQKQAKDWFVKSDVYSQILQYESKNSATSSITGVAGLMPTIAAHDFSTGFTDSATRINGTEILGEVTGSMASAVVSYSNYRISGSGLKVNVLNLPITYTIRNDVDPRRQLILSAPITYSQIGGANTAQLGLSAAYRIPLSDNFTVTPSAKYSAVISKDRATAAAIASASLTSSYILPSLGDFGFVLGNMVGYYSTQKVSSGDYSLNAHINHFIMKNGLLISQPVEVDGSKMSIEYTLSDTRYLSKDKPFISNMQDFSITLGNNKNVQDARGGFRAGLSFTRAPSANGVSAMVKYTF